MSNLFAATFIPCPPFPYLSSMFPPTNGAFLFTILVLVWKKKWAGNSEYKYITSIHAAVLIGDSDLWWSWSSMLVKAILKKWLDLKQTPFLIFQKVKEWDILKQDICSVDFISMKLSPISGEGGGHRMPPL